MNSIFKITALAVAMIAIAGVHALAQDEPNAAPRRGRPEMRSERFERGERPAGDERGQRLERMEMMRARRTEGIGLITRLDLTDEQRNQLAEIMRGKAEQFQATEDAITEAQTTLQELVLAGAEEADIRSAGFMLGNAMADRAILRVQTASEAEAILTSEQKAQLDELRAERQERVRAFQERRAEMMREFRQRRGTGERPAERPARPAGRRPE